MKKKILAFSAPVTITAAKTEGDKQEPAKFNVVAYTGGPLMLAGWDKPTVVDLSGMGFSRTLVANLDHNSRQRVGHVTDKSKENNQLTLGGVFSAATPFRSEVVASAVDGFGWEASIEAFPDKVVDLEAGKVATVNGQEVTGPAYIVRKSTLSGFAFVSHGADPNTSVQIAAAAAGNHGVDMLTEAERVWAEAMGVSIDDADDKQIAQIKANYAGKTAPKPRLGMPKEKLGDEIDAKRREVERVDAITDYALNAADTRPYNMTEIQACAAEAIEQGWSLEKFKIAVLEASTPPAHTVFTPRSSRANQITDKVLEAAIAIHGRLPDLEDHYEERTLDIAHSRFKSGIGLKQIMMLAAEANGYRSNMGHEVSLDVQRAAFGMQSPIRAEGFSTLSLPNTFAAVANKFLRVGWMSVDQTFLRIAAVRPVNDFKTIKTISLTGGLMFQPVGPDGEIKHGQVGELSYSNKADTYGILFAITRQDMINDDLGALTSVPRRIGRGGMLKLNDIGWAKFLNNGSFFTTGRANVLTGGSGVEGRLGLIGLQNAEAIFMAQTDPDGTPLGAEPRILLTPTPLKATGTTLMTSEFIISGTTASVAAQPSSNIFRGRFQLESSPYMSNSSYTGFSASAWYLLADPQDYPVIEIAALNGRIEPFVETAAAEFNTLGVQMRGYNDVGVELQEYRGGVRANGVALS